MEEYERPQIPQAVESERIILGWCLVDGADMMKRIAHIVTSKDFYYKKNVVIFRAMEKLFREQKEIDIITVYDFLELKGYADTVGGSTYMSELTDFLPPEQNIVTHARIVSDRAVLRRMIEASQQIIEKARTEDDLDKFLGEAEEMLKGVTRQSARSESKLNIVDIEEWRKVAWENQVPDGTVRGLSSGYKGLDDVTEGFEPGEMYILTGHTKHGKSQLATNWAVNVAQRGKTVLFINTEMTKVQMARRVNQLLGHDPIKGKILLNDRSDIDTREVVTIMENAKEKGCDMVVVDHLHYFARSEDNATGQISKYTKEFKDAAVSLDLPLLMLCHIDQSKPETMRPTIKMLKNSSSIAQDADMVITVFRNEDKMPGIMEVIRLVGRSVNNSNKYCTLYTDGFKLTETKPISFKEQVTMAQDTSRMLGEKDEDLYIPDWPDN